MNYKLWIMNYELWIMNYELWIMNYKLLEIDNHFECSEKSGPFHISDFIVHIF